MKTIKQNLGIDVDSKELKACFKIMQENLSVKIKASRTFKNNLAGFEAMKKWVNKKRVENLPIHLTMEATGVYYENVAYFFNDDESFIVHVVLANISKAFLKSLNRKSKTDKIDAEGLAQMGLERQLKVWEPISSQMLGIKRLTRERLRLQKEKTMVLNQLHAEMASYHPATAICKRYKKRITFIEKQVKEIEKDLHVVVELDPELANQIDEICKVPGIGFITAIGVIAEYNGFILFNNRNQVVSYAGYDVVKNESGISIKSKPRISKKGNSYVRQILYMAAMSSAVHHEQNRNYYQRIVDKTGIKMKANVAIQRKLLLLIYALFKNRTTYDPLHFLKVQQRLKPKQIKEMKLTEKLQIAD